jgi:hypothetical protein
MPCMGYFVHGTGAARLSLCFVDTRKQFSNHLLKTKVFQRESICRYEYAVMEPLYEQQMPVWGNL